MINIDPYSAEHLALLTCAFDQVAPKDDWKGPIDCLVPWETANIYKRAIEHFTATIPQCERVGSRAHLTSPGYRAGPAGDH